MGGECFEIASMADIHAAIVDNLGFSGC